MKKHQLVLYSSLIALTACGGSNATDKTAGNETESLESLLAATATKDTREEVAESDDYIESEEEEEQEEEEQEEEEQEEEEQEEDREEVSENSPLNRVGDGFFDNDEEPSDDLPTLDDLFERLTEEGGFDEIIRLIQLSPPVIDVLTEALADEQPLTMLLPDDEEIELLGEEALEELSSDPVALLNFLTNHIIADQNLALSDFNAISELEEAAARIITTIFGENIAVTGEGRSTFFNLVPGIQFNGRIGSIIFHRLGGVLAPTVVPEDEDIPSLDQFLQNNEDFEFTIFADLLSIIIDLFEELFEEIDGGFTFFIPVDSAFEVLSLDDDGAFLNALRDDPQQLLEFINNHLVTGISLTTNQLATFNGRDIETEGEQPVRIGVRDARITVNGVDVIGAEGIPVENGVVYPIGLVLLAADDDGTPSDEEGNTDTDDTTDLEETTDEEPTDEEPTDEEPTDEEPTDKEPTDEEPTDEEPTDEEPTDKEPTDEEPTDEEPTDVEGEGEPSDQSDDNSNQASDKGKPDDPLALLIRITHSQFSRVLDYLPGILGLSKHQSPVASSSSSSITISSSYSDEVDEGESGEQSTESESEDAVEEPVSEEEEEEDAVEDGEEEEEDSVEDEEDGEDKDIKPDVEVTVKVRHADAS